MKKEEQNLKIQEIDVLKQLLQKISNNPKLIANHKEVKSLIAKIYKTARKHNRQIQQQQLRQEDLKTKGETYIFKRNDETNLKALALDTPNIATKILNKPVRCYVCKNLNTEIHFFYHQLCPTCGDFNYQKRNQTTDLSNRIALITGGRVKIGYELALKMLRDGAKVIVTTRFPQNAWSRFLQEKDVKKWKNKLFIFGLDLRNIPALEVFITQLYEQFSHLDIIINNAAQTVKRPLAFYQHLLDKETTPFLLEANRTTGDLVTQNDFFPIGQLDKDLQQVDLRTKNSWRTKLNEVSSVEMLEVQLVNNIAPFILNSKLKNLMLQSTFERKFIINVSAMEGQFSKPFKSIFHPHTNMAKAALNMMTLTTAKDYANGNIFMNSVDTGWITDENPHPIKTNLRKNGFVTPLDIIDGAMRIYAPIVDGINATETPIFGQFLKDYQPVNW